MSAETLKPTPRNQIDRLLELGRNEEHEPVAIALNSQQGTLFISESADIKTARVTFPNIDNIASGVAYGQPLEILLAQTNDETDISIVTHEGAVSRYHSLPPRNKEKMRRLLNKVAPVPQSTHAK